MESIDDVVRRARADFLSEALRPRGTDEDIAAYARRLGGAFERALLVAGPAVVRAGSVVGGRCVACGRVPEPTPAESEHAYWTADR